MKNRLGAFYCAGDEDIVEQAGNMSEVMPFSAGSVVNVLQYILHGEEEL